MNLELISTVLVASLVGSLHCVGMCGGFVACYAVGASSSGLARLAPHAAYHLGRLVTYGLWGLLAGSLGALLDLAGHSIGIGRIAAVVAGTTMVIWGVALLASRLGVRWMPSRPRTSWERWIGRQLAGLVTRPPTTRAFLLGLSSTLLPCGFLYAFVITAAGTGSAATGALVMSAFWLGTVPLLVGLGLGIEQLGIRLRRFVPVATAMLMVGLGTFTVLGRVNVAANLAQHLEAGLRGVASKPVSPPMGADCPCHRH